MTTMTLAHQVGHRIRVRRADLRMTQTDLAKAIGIGQGNLSQLERGKKRLDLDLLERIAQVLQVRAVDLLDDQRKVA